MPAHDPIRDPYPDGADGRNAWIGRRRGLREDALDPRRPAGWFWEDERSASGELAKVLTVLLTNRECPWRCVFCDLWRHTLDRNVAAGDIPAQLDIALEDAGRGRVGPGARQIKLYNAGSYFDARAIPPSDDPAVAVRLRGFDRVIVESHPLLIGDRCWRLRDLLASGGGKGATLEVAMGLESANPEVLARLNKGMTTDDFAAAAAALRREGVAVRAFVLVQPPFETAEDPAASAVRSAEFAFDGGAGVVSLIPVRGGNGALEALEAQGHFRRPTLAMVERAMELGLRLGRGRVFTDLWDLEGLKGCDTCYSRRHERLAKMNFGQQILPKVRCCDCGAGVGVDEAG